MWKLYVMILCLAGFPGIMMAQVKDSIAIEPSAKTIPLAKPDTAKPYNPKRAIIRSAILPGWGQVTNKRYGKFPLCMDCLVLLRHYF